jgi:valyl-tRNA synthetase
VADEVVDILTDGKRSGVRVVADEVVDPEFGTGAVKVTPAHSFEDGEIAERHKLPVIEVIGKDGKMNENAGRFAGLTVLEAREAVVKTLKEKGLLIKVDEDYQNRVGVCYKCGTVIEPMLMEQWFVSMQPLAKKAIEAIEKDEIKFRPAKRKEIGLDYLKNIRDWNISRQIPWGIRIPAFYNREDDEWVYDESEEDEIKLKGKIYKRDADTFDTWMSSTQFPYLALRYDVDNPEESSEEFKDFFPTAWLQHGREIFNFWGLRMIMMALWNVDEIPFKTLYVNGNIRGEDGKKFSKSLGNAPSAIDLLDEFGSDAMRMGMISIDTVAGADKAFDRSKMVLGRNFANKLWNIARFVENLLDEAKLTSSPRLQSTGGKASGFDGLEPKTAADSWILVKLSEAREEISKKLDADEFGEAFAGLYDFVWNCLADWYVEVVKFSGGGNNPSPSLSRGRGIDTGGLDSGFLEESGQSESLGVLVFVLESVLKLGHPFAPFVTETIWQSLELKSGESLLVLEGWPDLEEIKFNKEKAEEFEAVIKATEFARKVKSFVGAEIEVVNSDNNLAELVASLAKLKSFNNLSESLAVPNLEGWSLLVSGENLAKYRNEIGKRVDEIEAKLKNLEARLNNSAYVDRAPKELVEESRGALAKLKDELRELKGE